MLNNKNDITFSNMDLVALLVIAFIPLIPKISFVHIGATAILFDDFAFSMIVLVGFGRYLFNATLSGSYKLNITATGILFVLYVTYKILNLSVLSLVYPLINEIGVGVLWQEGLLVLTKISFFMGIYAITYNYIASYNIAILAIKFHLYSAFLVVLVAMGQFFIYGHDVLTSTFRNMYSMRKFYFYSSVDADTNMLTTPFANGHEHLGGYMILMMFIVGCILLYWKSGNSGRRWGLALLWLGCVFTFFFSNSRGALIGGGCGVLILLFILVRYERFYILSRALMSISALLFAALAVDFFKDGRFLGIVLDRVTMLIDTLYHGNAVDDSAVNRIGWYLLMLDLASQKPLLGWGAGGAGRIAEGQLIRELVEGGIISAALFTLIILRSLHLALRLYVSSTTKWIRGFSLGYICGVVGAIGQSFFTELFIVTKFGVPFWSLTAIIHRLYIIELSDLNTNVGVCIQKKIGRVGAYSH